ncbi:MAG: toxic anion resistance protein [Clostridia bacterium]|nr:toxic anion resistance protein [Clostridia bacterium]
MGEFDQFALIPEQGLEPVKSQLDPEMQTRIEQNAARFSLSDNAAILGFGARTQKEMTSFTDVALRQMLGTDIEPLDGLMKTLAEQIRNCSFEKEAKGLLRKLLKVQTPLSEMLETYREAEPKINGCANDLLDRKVALMRDSALLERLYTRNEALYREICSLIVMGEEIIAQGKASGASPTGIAAMERRVQDLRLTRVASTQLAAQIRLIQENDKLTCERLQTTLGVTIPLWKAQMATALGLARANESLQAQRRGESEAERGIRGNMDEIGRQKDAVEKNMREIERERAEQTAQTLLNELDEIERSLDEQKKARQAVGGNAG